MGNSKASSLPEEYDTALDHFCFAGKGSASRL